MSHNPFAADPSIKVRYEASAAQKGAAVRAAIETVLRSRQKQTARNLGGVVTGEEVQALCGRFALGVEELMLLVLPEAQKLAHPPISHFEVGAVGLERDTGAIIVGGNVEFPGTHLGLTLHGEGVVTTRAFSRGTSLAIIAIGEAHPCGHCRQYLSEFALGRDLLLIDPLGHRLKLQELYPWPFDPAYLGETGIAAGQQYWPALELESNALAAGVSHRLETAGRRAYAPYSKCPSAVVLVLNDGNLIAGSAIESVAYNPTIGPLQAAIIDLRAHGYGYDNIAGAVLAVPRGGVVDYAASSTELLGRLAPGVPLQIACWAT